MDPASLRLVFDGSNVALQLLALAGVMESVGMKVDRLLQTDLSVGYKTLDQAKQATREQIPLLREARVFFNRAAVIERGHRKASALLGLAACHHALGEKQLHLDALKEILEIEPVGKTDIAKALGRHLASIPVEAGKKAMQSPGQALLSVGNLTLKSLILPYYAAKAAVSATKTVGNFLSEDGRESLVRDLGSNLSQETRGLIALQEAVSLYVDKPIPWLMQIVSAVIPWATRPTGRV